MHNTHKSFDHLDIPLVTILSIIYESAHRMIFSLPKFERYSLGEKIEGTILETIELIVMVNSSNRYEREKLLVLANAKIEILKILYRLALNGKMLDSRIYLALEQQLQEAGKQTQGWIKYERNSK